MIETGLSESRLMRRVSRLGVERNDENKAASAACILALAGNIRQRCRS